MTEMPDQVQRLLSTLIRRTNKGELEWGIGSSDTEFVLSASKGAIVIQSIDEDGAHQYQLTILSPDGVQVESYRSVERGQVTEEGLELGELYEGARRTAVGSTTVIKDLLDELDDGGIPF